MHYKTIALALIREEPTLHRTLRRRHALLGAMESCALRLKMGHGDWTEAVARKRPDSDSRQIASEAMELAIEDLRAFLRDASTSDAAAPPPCPTTGRDPRPTSDA